jgi:hypothetical protein
VHPNIPGQLLSREEYARVWGHSVKLLRRGFECGSILTVDPEEAVALNRPDARRYIYNQKHCVRCGGSVQSWDMAGRTCYACVSCQPISGRVVAPIDVAEGKVFISHCAQEDVQVRARSPEKLLVTELRAMLKEMGLDASGKKQELVDRLVAARRATDSDMSGASTLASNTDSSAHLEVASSSKAGSADACGDSTSLEAPGTQSVAAISSASFARKEKELAGESRAVEHVAEYDTTAAGSVVDWTDLEGDNEKKRKTQAPGNARAKRRLAMQ